MFNRKFGLPGSGSNLNKGLIFGCIGGAVALFGIITLLVVTGRSGSDEKCRSIGLSGGDFFGNSCEVDKNYASENIIIIAGNTKNSPVPTLSAEGQKIISNSILNGATIEIYSAAPTLDSLARIQVTPGEARNVDEATSLVKRRFTEINKYMSRAPKSNGVDYFGAISDAMVRLRRKGGTIMVIGSGLSDSGILNFANEDLLSLKPEDILDELVEKNEIPNISFDKDVEIKVYWSAIGQTVAPQAEIKSNNQKDRLRRIYELVLEETLAGNGKVDLGDTERMPSNSSVQTEYTIKPTSINNVGVFEQNFNEINSHLIFIAGTSNFNASDDDIVADLNPLREYLNSFPEARLTIEGYVAREGCGGMINVDLATSRAEATRDFLESKMHIHNVSKVEGSNETLYNECPEGDWDESIASLNRTVKILGEY